MEPFLVYNNPLEHASLPGFFVQQCLHNHARDKNTLYGAKSQEKRVERASMSEEDVIEKPVVKKPKTREDKQVEHIVRIKRTLIACILGIVTGVLSFVSGGTPNAQGIQDNALLAIMLMLAGVVLQRHIFILLSLDTTRLGAKDWFYQGFMTFAFWFMAWTILLTWSIGLPIH